MKEKISENRKPAKSVQRRIEGTTEGFFKTIKNIFNAHVVYRKQIMKLAKSDLVKTYRGAALGWAWAIIKPLVTIFVYWFAFAVGLRSSGSVSGYPFFLWLIAGVVPWFYMSDMLNHGTDCMRRYSYLITKMRFPVSAIPTFFSLSKLAVNVILMVFVVIVFWAMGYPPDIYCLQIPLYILFSFMFFTAWALFAGPLAAISKDFSNIVHSFVFAVFWLSGIIWNPETIENEALRRFLHLNPITFLTTGFRNALIDKIWFFEQPKRLMYFFIILLMMNLLAIWSYRKLRKDMPDVL